ncbi:MAG: hypothetical protein U0935_17245 [Pirellulales bacterium]
MNLDIPPTRPRRRRWRPQFSLRTLIIITTGISVSLGMMRLGLSRLEWESVAHLGFFLLIATVFFSFGSCLSGSDLVGAVCAIAALLAMALLPVTIGMLTL